MADQWRISSVSGTGFGEGRLYTVVDDDTGDVREVIVSTNHQDKQAELDELGEKIANGEFYR